MKKRESFLKKLFKIPDQKQFDELVSRGKAGSLPQMIASTVLLFFRPDAHDNARVTVGLLIVVLGTFARYLQSRNYLNLTPFNYSKIFSIVIFQALGWAIFSAEYLGNHETVSAQAIIFGYLVICAVMTGAVHTLATSTILFYSYSLVLLTPLIVSVAQTVGKVEGALLPLYFFLYFLFLERQRYAHMQIWDQWENTEKDLYNILNSFPGAISLIRKSKYVFVNSEVENITGIPARQIINGDVGVFNPDAVIPQMIRDLEIKNPELITREAILPTREGPKDFLIFGNRLDNGDIIMISLDVSSKKKLERELEAQKVKAHNSSKMAALGEMSGGLSHEINNPLAIITGNAYRMKQLINRKPIDEVALLKLVDSTTKVVDRIAKIVTGLKNFARDGDKDPFVKAGLLEIIQETLVFCESRFSNHGIELQKIGFDKEIFVECRSVQIGQVILNLLNNAHDAVLDSSEKTIQIEIKEDDDFSYIRVRDSGPGVPQSVREKIMAPFFTTKEVGKGTGLGLSISKGLIEDHHGKLYFDFNEPRTTVVIMLPKIQKRSAVKAS